MTDATPGALAEPIAALVGALIDDLNGAIADLADGELNAQAMEGHPPIGFHHWHVLRTADNIVNFVFHRDRPVWVEQRLHEEWGMPRIDQGTGMERGEAAAMRFAAAALVRYGEDVRDAVRPKIAAMTDGFLIGTTPARIAGKMTERRRIDTLGQVVLAHGSQHLGQIQVLRQLIGKPPPAA